MSNFNHIHTTSPLTKPLEYINALYSYVLNNRVVIITDSHVGPIYGQRLQTLINTQLTHCELITFPAGENHKNRNTQMMIEQQLLSSTYTKDTLIIALGGGVVTDLVGFIASSYYRGVSYISIPTTLLGMVDACLGGKTGINTAEGKNLIGAFYHPQAIFIDPLFLQTLPSKEWINGYSEIIKYGLVKDPQLLTLLTQVSHFHDPLKWKDLIMKCLSIKSHIIQQDPFEKNLRRILNFGHTIGHGLEAIDHYQTLSHGQAVAMGISAESFIAYSLNILSKQSMEGIHRYITNTITTPLPLPKSFSTEAMIKALHYDKKNTNHSIRCVMLNAIGSVVPYDEQYCRPIPKDILVKSLQWMNNYYGRLCNARAT